MDIIIGIGNDLRGDDGVGPRVVESIPAQADLDTMTVYQLVPELAEKIQRARRVLFVDASVEGEALRFVRLDPCDHQGLGHACSPAALLGWTKRAFDRVPEAWLLSIPGTMFEFCEHPSPKAAAYIPEAVARIESWLGDCPAPVLSIRKEEA